MIRILLPAVVVIAGCGQGQPSATQAPAATQESATTPARLEADDPRAGMNNTRPDSVKDVKPEPGTPQPPQ